MQEMQEKKQEEIKKKEKAKPVNPYEMYV